MTCEEKARIRKKWKRWLKAIGNDLGCLLIAHEMFVVIQAAFKDNKNIQRPSLVYRWIADNYAARAAVGIRRLTDRHGAINRKNQERPISLHWLIQDISDHADTITRQDFIAGCTRGNRGRGRIDAAECAAYDYNQFADRGCDEISKRKLSQDLKRLSRDTKRVKTFVDKWIAHHDADQRRFPVGTYADVGEALKDIDEIYCTCVLLLTGDTVLSAKPELQYDWREPLRHPWIEAKRRAVPDAS
jgi:hypothetical protein